MASFAGRLLALPAPPARHRLTAALLLSVFFISLVLLRPIERSAGRREAAALAALAGAGDVDASARLRADDSLGSPPGAQRPPVEDDAFSAVEELAAAFPAPFSDVWAPETVPAAGADGGVGDLHHRALKQNTISSERASCSSLCAWTA